MNKNELTTEQDIDAVIVPLRESSLYPEPGLDFIRAAEYGTDGECIREMEPVMWVPAGYEWGEDDPINSLRWLGYCVSDPIETTGDYAVYKIPNNRTPTVKTTARRTVATQPEFDQAVEDGIDYIDIKSAYGVCVEVAACGSSTVRACGSSTVRAYGSSTVRACDSSTVDAYDSSVVRAYDSSVVRAYGLSTVDAYDSSTVDAYGLSTVRACDSSTVDACDSSTVDACDSSTVAACDSSVVRAYDSSVVRAYDSSVVRACDSSTVRAMDRVAVHLHSGRAHVAGGVLIDHTQETGINN